MGPKKKERKEKDTSPFIEGEAAVEKKGKGRGKKTTTATAAIAKTMHLKPSKDAVVVDQRGEIIPPTQGAGPTHFC